MAFNLEGATPNTGSSPFANNGKSFSSTPQGKALSAFQGFKLPSFSGTVSNPTGNPSPSQSGLVGSTPGTSGGLILPTTPVASTSYTDAGGNTVTQKHQPADTSSSQPLTYKGVSITPGSDASLDAQIAAIDAKPSTSSNTNAGLLQPAPYGTNAGSLPTNGAQSNAQLQSQGSSNPVYSGATGGLLTNGSGNNPTINADQAALSGIIGANANGNTDSTQNGSNGGLANIALSEGQNGLATSGAPSYYINGNSANVGAYNSAAYGQALNKYQADVTQQGQENTALNNAGSLTQPTANAGFFGSPESGGLVGSGNQLLTNAVGQAIQLVQNGTAPSDPAITSLLSPFGTLGQQAFTQAQEQVSNGTYNPTAQNVSSQTNASQGATYQQQATGVSNNLASLKKVTPQITSLLNGAGLNQQDNPFYNKSINTYASQLQNPAAVASLKAGMGEIQNYVAQILGSSGDLTPTAVTQITASFDPGNFTSTQLSQFLQNVDNYGQARLQALQQTSQASYGTSGAYSGTTATPSASATIPSTNSPSGLNTNNPVIEGLAGTAIGSLDSVLGAISGIANTVFK